MTQAEQTSVAPPKLRELFVVFFRVSLTTIGGGYVMFPILKHAVVDTRGWISDEQMVDAYALSQSVPGIIAMNTATLIGYRKRGLAGAWVCAVGMATPSVLIILLVATCLTPFFEHPWMQKAFAGIRSAVVAMIIMAVWQVGKKSVNSLSKGVLAAGAFVAIAGLHIHPLLLIVSGGLLGSVLFRKETTS